MHWCNLTLYLAASTQIRNGFQTLLAIIFALLFLKLMSSLISHSVQHREFNSERLSWLNKFTCSHYTWGLYHPSFNDTVNREVLYIYYMLRTQLQPWNIVKCTQLLMSCKFSLLKVVLEDNYTNHLTHSVIQ